MLCSSNSPGFYPGPVDIQIDEMPIMEPKLINTDGKNAWKRFWQCGKSRNFLLYKDWQITLSGMERNPLYGKALNGTIVIKRDEVLQNKTPQRVCFDGATVPLPRLVWILSLGAIRPLGVLLMGSIVHDYCFKYGGLWYRDESGEVRFKEVNREQADRLFHDMTVSINKTPLLAKLTWWSVRIAKNKVPYITEGKPSLS